MCNRFINAMMFWFNLPDHTADISNFSFKITYDRQRFYGNVFTFEHASSGEIKELEVIMKFLVINSRLRNTVLNTK